MSTVRPGMGRARGRGWCRMAPVVAAALVVVAGCTYSEREPGLLDRETPQPTVGPPSSTSPPTATPVPVTNPELPVAGESVWTSADGLDVQVRFAVHAVRRVDGGTVLDWSVTPIRAANLRPGDAVPDSVDLGLSRRWESSANVFLVDAPRRTVYRPLVRAPDSDYCLCTPIWLSQRKPARRRDHVAAGGVPRAAGCPAYGRCGHPDRAPVRAGPRHAGWPGPGRQPPHGSDAACGGSPSGRPVGHVPLRRE